MKTLFKPGIFILDKLTFSKKFILLFIVVVVTFSYLLLDIVRQTNDRITTVENELIGVDLIEEIYPVLKFAQQHRGLTSNLVSGDETAAPKREEAGKNLDGAFYALLKDAQKYSSYKDIEEKIVAAQNQWKEVKSASANGTVQEGIKVHSDLIIEILDILNFIADETTLALESDRTKNYLNSLLTETLPPITENMGKARATGVSVATQKELSDDNRYQLLFLMQTMQSYVKASLDNYEAIFKTAPALKEQLEAKANESLQSTEDILSIIDTELLNATTITIVPADYFDATTQTIDSIFELIDFQKSKLQELLEADLASYETKRAITLVVIMAIVFVLMYVLLSFYFSIQTQVKSIQHVAEQLASGDLTGQIPITSKDEFASISLSLNNMITEINTVITDSKVTSIE